MKRTTHNLGYKARLVVKGFGQRKISMVELYSIIIILALATNMYLQVEQLDIKIIFLHGDLKKKKGKEQIV